jgi:hypothetical protein
MIHAAIKTVLRSAGVFHDCGQQIIDNASTIKAKKAEILNVYLEV